MERIAFRRPRVAALALLAAVACSPTRPTTPQLYPVTGRVEYADGQPVPDGTVELRSLSDTSLTTNGFLKEDGSFTIETLAGNERVPGAAEGKYEVTVIPPQSDDQNVVPETLPAPVVVEARENTLPIRLRALPRK